jgi:serine/threonine-protein phosphatase 2A regulatory subunit A
MAKHPNYLYRMTTVQAITVSLSLEFTVPFLTICMQTIVPSLDLDVINTEIVERLLELADDPIPNIKFNVAKSLEVLATNFGTTPEGKQLVLQKILPKLEAQKNDADADVRYFAARAIQNTQNALGLSSKL